MLWFGSLVAQQRALCPKLLAAVGSASAVTQPTTPSLTTTLLQVLRAPEAPLNLPALPGLQQAECEIVITSSCCTEWDSGLSNSF